MDEKLNPLPVSTGYLVGWYMYRYLMACVAPTHDAVTKNVTHSP